MRVRVVLPQVPTASLGIMTSRSKYTVLRHDASCYGLNACLSTRGARRQQIWDQSSGCQTMWPDD